MLGMTLAWRLRRAGHEVVLYEAAPHLGGLADAWEFGGITWDRHYHVTLLSDMAVRGLLRELDLEEDMRWVETRTGFYTGGKWFSMSNTLEFLRFPPLNLLDKLRLGGTIFFASKLRNWKKLEYVPVEKWLTRLSGKRVFQKMWLPLLKAKLGENYQKASAAFIWAIIARMYAARQSGLKKEMFGYLRGGYGRLLEVFEQRLKAAGVEIHTRTPIRSVTEQGGLVTVSPVSGRSARFDEVIVTTPCRQAAKMCTGLTGAEVERLKRIEYQGIVCVSVLLNKPFKGFYVTNITDDWVPFTAVIEMTALVDPETFGGKHLVYLPKYVSPRDPLFEQSDKSIVDSFIGALRRMNPELEESDILATRISRVREVLALSTLNYSVLAPPMETSVPGVSVVNSSQIVNGTLNVNECVRLADAAMAQLTGEVSA